MLHWPTGTGFLLPTLPLQRLYLHQRYAASGSWEWTIASNLKRSVRDSELSIFVKEVVCASDVRKRRNRSWWISGGTHVEYTTFEAFSIYQKNPEDAIYLAQFYTFQCHRHGFIDYSFDIHIVDGEARF